MSGVRLSVLGKLRAEVDGAVVDLGGPRQRAVLAPLVLARGAVVPVDQIVEAVWGDRPPQASTASLHSFVSNLRRALRPASGEQVLVRESVGYALRLPADAVDIWRFDAHVRRGTELLETDPAGAVVELEAGLQLWRGTPLLDYRDSAWAEPEIARLTALRTVAHEQLLTARLHVQEPALLVPELQLLVDDEPLREERWRLLVLALYRAGRQADALAALRRAREVLADELGVDPGPALRALEEQVLQQADALAPAARRTPVAASSSPARPPLTEADDLVERDRELRALDLVLGSALDGEGQLVLVRGPAGIGKTRLMTEVRRRGAASGMLVLRARGSELEQEFGFGAVRQLFEPLLADPETRADLLSGAAAAAAAVFDLAAGGAEEPSFATLHGLYWLTVNAAAKGPLLLSVDDLHWCDAGSLRYLAYVQRRLEGLPVAVVGAARTGERFPTTPLLDELARDPTSELVQPGPLSRAAVADVVRARMGDHADPAFCAACFDSTSGNPLLLRQLLRALEADNVTPDASSAETARAVGSRAVSSMVLIRLRRLPPSAVAVARALAVLGDGAGVNAVATLAELHEVEVAAATELLAAAEVLRPHAPLGFVHALVRDAVYRDLAAGEQQLLHDRAARLLGAAGAPAEQVAAQLLHAPSRHDPWAVGVLRQAAAEALRRGAPESAAAYLERALAEPAGSARGEVLFELGWAETSSNGPAALLHLEQAYEELADEELRSRAAIALARTMVFSGPREGAITFARRAAEQLGDDRSDDRQALLALQRMAGWMRGLPPETWGYETEPEAIGSGAGAHMLEAAVGWSMFCRNRPVADVVPLLERAIGDRALFAVDNGLLWATALATLELCEVEVMRIWDEVIATARERGSLFMMLTVHLWRGHALWRRGELLEAEESLRTSLAELETWGAGLGSGYAVAFLGQVLVDLGQVDAALELGSVPIEAVDGTDGERLLREARAAALLSRGRHEECLRELESAESVMTFIVNPAWAGAIVTRVRALQALGRDSEALEVADRTVRRAEQSGIPGSLGVALHALGLAQGAAGEPALREAVTLLAGTHRRLAHADALSSLADVVRATDPAHATGLAQEALRLAESCSAAGLASRLRATLVAAGVHAQASGDVFAALTAQERQVARLLDDGADHVAVAQALSMSPTAAQRQVDLVRDKLASAAAPA